MRRGRIEGGKFGSMSFAQDNGPIRLESGYRGGIVVRDIVGKNLRPAGGAHPSGKKNIFDAQRYPMQGAPYLSTPHLCSTARGTVQSASPVECDPGLHLRF